MNIVKDPLNYIFFENINWLFYQCRGFVKVGTGDLA